MDPFHEQLARIALHAAESFHDPGFDQLRFAEALAAIDRFPDRLFQPYGMGPGDVLALRERMRAWARRISAAH